MKKAFLLGIAMMISASTASAQLVWTNIATATNFAAIAPTGAQMGGTAVVTVGANSFLYLVGPNIGADSQNIFYCDVTNVEASTGPWATATWVAPANDIVYTTQGTFGYNGRLYVVSGSSNGTTPDYNGIRVFAPTATGDITAIQQEFSGATGNPPINDFATSAAVDPATGYVYIISTLSANVQQVSIDAGTGDIVGPIQLAATLPTPVRQSQIVVRNGYLYVPGGWNGTAATSTVYYAQIQAGGLLGTVQTATAPMPFSPGISDGGSAVLGNNLFVRGGTTTNNNATTVDNVYKATFSGADITAWTVDTDISDCNSIGIRRIGASVGLNRIFMVGGRIDAATISGAVRVASDPSAVSDWQMMK